MNIMVTGVTGGYGGYAAEYLKEFAPNDDIYVLVRNEEKAKDFNDVNVRVGDYADADSMVEALKDIDRLLFVSVSIPGIQKNVVEAAKVNDVKYIAYTSLFGLENPKFGLEINHRETEELIKASGIRHAFLRDNWYVEMPASYLNACKKYGKYLYFSDEGVVSWALKREYAEAGARVIADGSYEGILNLSNTPITYKELGEAFNLETELVSRKEFENVLSKLDISDIGAMLTLTYQDYAQAGGNGEEEGNPTEFEKILGHPLTPYSEAIEEVIEKNLFL